MKVTDCTVQSAEYWCFYGTGLENFLKWQKCCDWVFPRIYSPWSCMAKKAVPQRLHRSMCTCTSRCMRENIGHQHWTLAYSPDVLQFADFKLKKHYICILWKQFACDYFVFMKCMHFQEMYAYCVLVLFLFSIWWFIWSNLLNQLCMWISQHWCIQGINNIWEINNKRKSIKWSRSSLKKIISIHLFFHSIINQSVHLLIDLFIHLLIYLSVYFIH